MWEDLAGTFEKKINNIIAYAKTKVDFDTLHSKVPKDHSNSLVVQQITGFLTNQTEFVLNAIVPSEFGQEQRIQTETVYAGVFASSASIFLLFILLPNLCLCVCHVRSKKALLSEALQNLLSQQESVEELKPEIRIKGKNKRSY